LTKQLRLVVGELTDIGRRRERNQDNVTHFVPEDAEVLARRGALFVVCDGMGGHAAGEIASEIAVNTIREVYFEDTRDDVVTALSRAVRAANNAIFEHAREHQTHSGMGTTCVALALVGGRGFFANVGDSRAYLVRDGVMRQVTLDHSWVAEQVRAGILTDQQARVHAHRNVITRSLGTQPEVVADLFIEDMREGDHVLLCSDGLHGYVTEEDILDSIKQMEPDDSAHHLIDMANGNGGPDNITAVVVRLVEVPESSDELDLPQTIKMARDRTITDMPTQPPMTEAAVALRRGASTGVLAHVAATDAPALPAAASAASSVRELPAARARGRWPVTALRILAVAALLLVVAGMWDVVAGPYATGVAANNQALHDIAMAESVAHAASSQQPPAALATLATAQETLTRDLSTLPLDSTSQSKVNQALNTIIAPAVRQTLQAYDDLNLITNLQPSGVNSYTVSCASGTFASGLQTLAAVGPASSSSGQITTTVSLYALTGTGALYALNLSTLDTTATCGSAPLIAGNVVAITSDASQLYALVAQGSTWQVLQVGPDGKTTEKISQSLAAGVSPGALAVHGGDFYVSYAGAAAGNAGIWHFNGDLKKPQAAIGVASAVRGLTVASDGTPFALLVDGTLVQLDATGHAVVVPVAVAPLVADTAPSNYVASTPVPTLPPTPSAAPSPTVAATPSDTAGATSTAVAGGLAPEMTPTAGGTPSATPATSTPVPTPAATPTATVVGQPTPSAAPALFTGASGFAADRAANGSVYVGDGASARVIRFGVNGSALQVPRQYAYGAPLVALQSVTISPDGTRLFAWSGSHLVQVMLPS
jgi:serine/threonine protein phosphatase PrpC